MTIGGVRGKAIGTGGAGGSFSREDLTWLAQKGTLYPNVKNIGLTATGGVVSDYTSGDDVYRAHIFTSSGTFQVSSLGTMERTVDITAVGGGGGGSGSIPSYWAGAGGGAGGMLEITGYPVSQTTYPVVIGAGGASSAGAPGSTTTGTTGVDTEFNNPGATPVSVFAKGGGGGGGSGPNVPGAVARDDTAGGSPGGVGSTPALSPIAAPAVVTHPNNPAINALTGCTLNHYGNLGGSGEGGSTGEGTGGGGAGGTGTGVTPPKSATHDNAGGAARANTYGFGPTNPKNYAKGGSGGPSTGTGDGPGADAGDAATGGGGCGGANPPAAEPGGSGGSGILIVRYLISTTQRDTAKATGGTISFYNSKTIHTFTSSGTFATTSDWSSTNVEYVVIGGGGSGAAAAGGAGGYITNTNHPIGSHPVSVTVQVGAGGAGQNNVGRDPAPGGNNGTPSYFGTPLTAYGGGTGAGLGSASLATGIPGGSGGGGARYSGGRPGGDGSKQTGTSTATPITPQGNPGGDGMEGPQYGHGGGGGAGGAGGDASPNNGAAPGGAGLQAPSTFHDPLLPTSGVGYPGPSGSFWFAGGGGGGWDAAGSPAPGPGPGGGPGGPYAGAGGGATAPTGPHSLFYAKQNSGSGGGGSTSNPWISNTDYSSGGSGVVIIAYPT